MDHFLQTHVARKHEIARYHQQQHQIHQVKADVQKRPTRTITGSDVHGAWEHKLRGWKHDLTARNHEVKVLTYTLPTNFLGETLNVVPETATIVGETIM